MENPVVSLSAAWRKQQNDYYSYRTFPIDIDHWVGGVGAVPLLVRRHVYRWHREMSPQLLISPCQSNRNRLDVTQSSKSGICNVAFFFLSIRIYLEWEKNLSTSFRVIGESRPSSRDSSCYLWLSNLHWNPWRKDFYKTGKMRRKKSLKIVCLMMERLDDGLVRAKVGEDPYFYGILPTTSILGVVFSMQHCQ